MIADALPSIVGVGTTAIAVGDVIWPLELKVTGTPTLLPSEIVADDGRAVAQVEQVPGIRPVIGVARAAVTPRLVRVAPSRRPSCLRL